MKKDPSALSVNPLLVQSLVDLVDQLPLFIHMTGFKRLILGMVIPPLIGNPYNWYIKPYYKVDDHPYHRKAMGV